MLALGLVACGPSATKPPSRADLGAEIVEGTSRIQPEVKPGECWDSDISPAIIETVTEQKIVTPEVRDDAGQVITPATYSTTTRQEMVQERTEIWFRTPCPEVQDLEFITTLQRALKARGYYLLPLTGQMGTRQEPVYENQVFIVVEIVELLIIEQRLIEWKRSRTTETAFH